MHLFHIFSFKVRIKSIFTAQREPLALPVCRRQMPPPQAYYIQCFWNIHSIVYGDIPETRNFQQFYMGIFQHLVNLEEKRNTSVPQP